MKYEQDVANYPDPSNSLHPQPDEERPPAPQWQNDIQYVIDKFEVNDPVAFSKMAQAATNKDIEDETALTGELEDPN